MTDEEILEMARTTWYALVKQPVSETELEWYPAPHSMQSIVAFARLVAEKQKEADARICEQMHEQYAVVLGKDCAAAIRSQK